MIAVYLFYKFKVTDTWIGLIRPIIIGLVVYGSSILITNYKDLKFIYSRLMLRS